MNILFPYMARWKAFNWTRYHSLLTCIAEMGHHVYVLQPPAMKSNETNFQEIEVDIPCNLHIVDVAIPRWLWGKKLILDKITKKGLYSIFSLGEARRIVRDKKIDLMLLYNIPQCGFLKLPVEKIVFDYADDYVAMLDHELGFLSNRLTIGLGKKILNKMIDESSMVCAVSHVLAKQFGNKMKVLPNGIDERKVSYAKKNPLNLGLKRPIVGFIGSFEYFIDFDLIIETAALLPDITFLMVGKGRLWEYVHDQVAGKKLNNVVLTGGAVHQDVFRYIGQMDICLNIFKKIPISHGACPIKLFEYLSMEKPIISTRLDELKYIDNDFLLYGDTVEEISGHIEHLLVDQDFRNKIISKGWSNAMQNYTWGKIADNFMKIADAKVWAP